MSHLGNANFEKNNLAYSGKVNQSTAQEIRKFRLDIGPVMWGGKTNMLPIENFLLSDVSRIQNCCTLHFRKNRYHAVHPMLHND